MVSPATTTINCSQCGGELHPDEGQIFVTCPYCSATVYLDRSRVVFHWYLAPTLNDQQATAALYRWMSGSQTVKDLDKKARLVGQSFQFFPLWYFKRKTARGEEELLQPAAATSVTEITRLKLPAGDLRSYDPNLDAQSAQPSVPLEAALEWAVGKAAAEQQSARAASALQQPLPLPGQVGPQMPNGGAPGDLMESSLVHVPLYFFKYAFRDQTYTAIVDAASGTVLASLYPPKSEAPYRAVGAVAAVLYLCLAMIPLGFMAADGGSGAGTGFLVCGGLGLLAAPFLFAWAFWVASKV